MINLDRVVSVHKRLVEQLINNSSVTLTIRLPVPKVTSGVNPLFGDMTRESNKTGETKGPFNCLWYDALSAKRVGTETGVETTIENLQGQFRDASAFAEVWLEDVLIDPFTNASQTWFDKCVDVLSEGKRYKFLGLAKIGLSTASPYVAMVALKGGVGFDE